MILGRLLCGCKARGTSSNNGNAFDGIRRDLCHCEVIRLYNFKFYFWVTRFGAIMSSR